MIWGFFSIICEELGPGRYIFCIIIIFNLNLAFL